jgi:branched-subunit amino acid transport protein
MNEPLMIGGMALVTFLIRYPVLALVGKIDMPKRIFDALRYVAPSVLAAIVIPVVLLPNDKPIQQITDAIPLVATLLSALVMWRSKNLLATVIVGIVTFLILRIALTLFGQAS